MPGSVNGDVSALQQALGKNGEIIGDYSAAKDGTFTDGTAAAVVAFQKKYGITQTGTVSSETREKLNALYGCKTPPIDNQAPVTSEISGPTSLKVNEMRTWTVKASDPKNKKAQFDWTRRL